MQYSLKRVIDTHPEWLNGLKQKCYATNGCLATVHSELGPFLNEYMYQEALQILLNEQHIPYQRLSGKRIGVLFNFGSIRGQSEHYYLDTDGTMYMF